MTRARTALVTGSAGFVGRHVTRELVARGYAVTGIDLVPGTPAGVEVDLLGNALELFRDDGRRFELVVHAAAVVGGRTMIDGRPLELAAVDLELDAALWRWALRTRPGRIVYLSSSAAYPVKYQRLDLGHRLEEGLIDHRAAILGTPDATYGLVKLVGERLALEAAGEGLAVTVVRPFSGYGADQALDYPFPAFIDRARRRADPFDVWGTGRQVRDFVHIDDVVAAIVALVDAEVDGPVNIGTGRPTSFLELAELVTAAAGYTPTIRTLEDAPVGVEYRVADTRQLEHHYTPRITLEAAIAEALGQ
jgi:nucleoside-diphosphate-sugar epimerase